MRARDKEAATLGWNATPVSTARLAAEMWSAIRHEKWSLVVSDRYPTLQREVPEGPALSFLLDDRNAIYAWLARIEERALQLFDRFAVERVQDPRTIEGDRRDSVFFVV